MSLDAATIVGLVFSVLGLWGLPTFWRSILYASRVPRQRSKISARISNQLDALRNGQSGNLRVRGVDGFEARVEGIERQYHRCYTEMTCAYTTRICLTWIVWCFRVDPYLSKLLCLEGELSSLLKQIEDYHNLGNILIAAVNTTERAAEAPSRTRAPTSPNPATVISVGGISRNPHVHQPPDQDQSSNSSGLVSPYISSISTAPRPTSNEAYNKDVITILPGTATLDHPSLHHGGPHVSEKPYRNQNGTHTVLPTPPVLPLSSHGYSRLLDNHEVAESSFAQRPAGTEEHIDIHLPLSKPNYISSPHSPDRRGNKHSPSLRSATRSRQSNSGGINEDDIPSPGPKDPPVKLAIIDGSDVLARRNTSQAAASAGMILKTPGTPAADGLPSSSSSNQQNGIANTEIWQPPEEINWGYDLPPAAIDAHLALIALTRAIVARDRTHLDAFSIFGKLRVRPETFANPALADIFTSCDQYDDVDCARPQLVAMLANAARIFTAEADATRALADAATAVIAAIDAPHEKPPEMKAAAPGVEMNKEPQRISVRARL